MRKIKKKNIVQNEEDIREIVDMVVEAKNDPTQEGRLELVERLLAREYKRFRIVAIVSKLYKVSRQSVDRDIAKAKDRIIEFSQKRKRSELAAEAVGRMKEVVSRAHERGDFGSVVQASKHLDTLTGLLREPGEDGNPLQVRIVTLPKNGREKEK